MSAETRLMSKLVAQGDCLVFTGSLTTKGYGTFHFKGKTCLAHRVAFELHHGREPTGLLMHSCDNPACCNVEHLSEGDDMMNQRDCISKGRKRTKLTRGQADEIRNSTLSQRKLAVIYGVSPRLIFNIKGGTAWQTHMQVDI